MKRLLFLLLLMAPPASAAELKVGTDKQFRTVASAVKASKALDVISIDGGLYRNDTFVIPHDLTLRAASGLPHLQAVARIANGKGIVVIANGSTVLIEGLKFSGAKVTNRNGAGIRLTEGHLTVVDSIFDKNENGILTASDPASTLDISGSTFTGNGIGEANRTHGVYIGKIRSLDIDDSLFSGGGPGHHVKSRAGSTTVTNSTLDDAAANTSYNIDVPQGGRTVITGNALIQGIGGNRTLIAFGAEKHLGLQPMTSLRVERNGFKSDPAKAGVGVYNHTTVPAELTGNVFVGVRTPLKGPGTVTP